MSNHLSNHHNASEAINLIRALLEFAYHRFTPPPDYHLRSSASEQGLTYFLEWSDLDIVMTTHQHQTTSADPSTFAMAVKISTPIESEPVSTNLLYAVPLYLTKPQLYEFAAATFLDILDHLPELPPGSSNDSAHILQFRLDGVSLYLDEVIEAVEAAIHDRELFADFFDFNHEPTVRQLNCKATNSIRRLRGIVALSRNSLDWIQKGGLPRFCLQCLPRIPQHNRHELFIDLSHVSFFQAIACTAALDFADAVLVQQPSNEPNSPMQLHLLLWSGWREQSPKNLDERVDQLYEWLDYNSEAIHQRHGWWSTVSVAQ